MKPVNRHELEELLVFPREYLRTRLPTVHDCRHATNFDPDAPECHACRATYECSWLWANDEYSALQNAASDRVVEALRTVLNQALVNVARHEACGCQACSWVHRAARVVKRAETVGVESSVETPKPASQG